MRRRDVLNTGLILGTLAMLPKLAGAADQDAVLEVGMAKTLALNSEIGSNHGHELTLNAAAFIELLRQTKSAQPAKLNIQGSSSHPHELELTQGELMLILLDGALTKNSNTVAGHAHKVTVKLEITGS